MEPTQNPVQIPTSQPKPNYLIIIIASIFSIILLSSIIYLYLQNQQLKKQVKVDQKISPTIQTPQKVSSISISPNETANWQTYVNSQYFYSLKFPKEWLSKSFGPGPVGLQPLNSNSKGVILSPNNQEQTVPDPMFEIQAEGPENLSRTTYSEWEKQIKTDFSEGYKLTKESSSTISGTTAIVLEGEHIYPKSSTYIKQLIFAPSEKGVYFTITIVSDTKQESLIFDQVLSTFKFVDKNNLCELNDKTLCGFFVDKTLKTSDIDYILSLQQKTTVTCKKDQAYNPKMCEGVSDGEKREGYAVGYIRSEGTIFSENEYKIFLNDYFKNNYSYHGIIIDSNKTAVVFVSNDKKTLFVFPLVKKNGIWTMSFILFGFDQTYLNLDKQVLDWFN